MSVSDPSVLDTHWNANAAPLRPSASAMPSVDAVSVSPARARPEISGTPVAGLLGGPATVTETAFDSGRPLVVLIAPAA